MENLYYAAWIIIATGIIGIGIGIFDILSKPTKARGFGTKTSFAKVTNIKEFNQKVGILWIIVGILIMLDGSILLFNDPEEKTLLVGILAVLIYTIASIVYVIGIEGKYRVEDRQKTWKEVKEDKNKKKSH